MTQLLPDHAAREQALDIAASYIVQAPAGSGKTELLTLRYLKLLAICREPEEVLAITFTRKAASEMRDRVINVLNWAQQCLLGTARADDAITELRLAIASTVLLANEQNGWRLLDNPGRMRIQTIDSFCFYLSSQLPILSQVGGNPAVTENAEPVFREAAKATLAQLETDTTLADSIGVVLRHLDNDIATVEQQLLKLLYQRDQWSSYIHSITSDDSETRHYLKLGLEELITESLSDARKLLEDEEALIVKLLNYSASNRIALGGLPDSLSMILPISELPAPGHEQLPAWKLLLSIFLKKDGGWLKAATRNHGFPPGPEKDERKALVERLEHNDELLQALNYIALLPDPELDSKQWQFQVALCHVLQALNLQLLLAFRNFRVVDYTQTGAAALLALGDADQPTDLAMALDNVIQHILVDEFQDTSQLQLELLERLTAGWTPGDGRSLFLVGDAMQSCYGFRNANVGIYLGVLEQGLGDLTLQPLQLSSNFRSQRPVVEWVNEVFQTVFPTQPNISRGAVPYSAADIIHEGTDSTGVSVEIIDYDAEQRQLAQLAEADWVAKRVVQLREDFPGDSIAILVRTRGQLENLVPALRAAGLQWTATDIDRLASLPVIADLSSLVRVILHPGDRLAWLALLRAPWCGLTTADLFALTQAQSDQPLWETIQQFREVPGLSAEAKAMLPGFVDAMTFIMHMRFRESLRHCVEAAWTLLRGAFCYQNELDEQSVNRFYELLDEQEVAGGLADYFRFEEILAEAFVPSPADAELEGGLHLLTMHKAKGLEYDHVLLPGLNRSPRSDDKQLLIWHQRLNRHNEQRLFLAGVTETGSEDTPLYQLLRHEQKSKGLLESARLLYIAVTRARKSATLTAVLGRDKNGEVKDPESSSLLSRMWPELTSQDRARFTKLEDYLEAHSIDAGQANRQLPRPTPLQRFTTPVQLNSKELEIIARQIATDTEDRADSEQFEDAELQSIVGTLIHACLEHYVQAQDQARYLEQIGKLRDFWTLQLRHLELDAEHLRTTLDFIEQSFRNTVQEPSLGWIFDPSQHDSACELPLSTVSGTGFVSNHVLDRSFIDSDGVRWIIDYKSARPTRYSNEEDFIREQLAHHAPQLENYRSLFAAMESRPIKTALLLTAIPRLVEVD